MRVAPFAAVGGEGLLRREVVDVGLRDVEDRHQHRDARRIAHLRGEARGAAVVRTGRKKLIVAGLRPDDPPWNMRAAMILFAALCIGIGCLPDFFYTLLPFQAGYRPYTLDHVVAQVQLLHEGLDSSSVKVVPASRVDVTLTRPSCARITCSTISWRFSSRSRGRLLRGTHRSYLDGRSRSRLRSCTPDKSPPEGRP